MPSKALKIFLEIIEVFVLALIVALPIRFFFFQPFLVSGSSMEPNFHSGEYLLVDEITYRFREPKRGEVIVFRSPQNPMIFLIKRIIALPGETIEISEGKVKIWNLKFPQGKVLNEPYIKGPTPGNLKLTLKKNEYFVLGDNRSHSSDSRSFGPILRKDIIGRAWLSISPSKGIHLFSSPNYIFNSQ